MSRAHIVLSAGSVALALVLAGCSASAADPSDSTAASASVSSAPAVAAPSGDTLGLLCAQLSVIRSEFYNAHIDKKAGTLSEADYVTTVNPVIDVLDRLLPGDVEDPALATDLRGVVSYLAAATPDADGLTVDPQSAEFAAVMAPLSADCNANGTDIQIYADATAG